MAKILNFRDKDGGPSGQDFLTDENQTLSFRMSKDGAVSLGNLSQTGLRNLFPDPRKDWSNQELADLFRVRQLLSGANVPVETDRGVTDEGDPWFVFCHANGEVFIHLCRINGLYVLDSPNVLRPLRGADFNELIADFTNQALPARSDDEEGTERRVIRLERGGKIRLHPSAMLAALIWTLFLASEELVLLAPEEPVEQDSSEELLNFENVLFSETANSALRETLFDDSASDLDSLAKDNQSDNIQDTPEGEGQLREALLQQQGLTVTNNAFTMGLSTIAIAMGFMSETVLLDNQRKILESLKQLGFSQYGMEAEQTEALDVSSVGDSKALLAMLAEFLGLDLSLNTELADLPTNQITEKVHAQQDANHLLDSIVEAENAITAVNIAAIRNKNKEANAKADDAVELRPRPAEALPTDGKDTLQADAAEDSTTLTLSEIIHAWKTSMEETHLGQAIIKTNLGISDNDVFALFDLIDTSAQQRTTNFQEFDDLAQRLIDYLEAKGGELGIIEMANEIIMIDRTAVTGGEIEYMHWETSDGKVISLVGLASDFQQFDMTA